MLGHFRGVKDPNLQSLICRVPDVLSHSKASQFSDSVILPASSVYVCLFLVSLIQDGVSCNVIDEAHYGLKWVHKIAGFEDACNASIVLSFLDAAKRLLSIRVRKKEPVTPEIIHLIFEKFGHPSATQSDLRLLTLCVLCYTGFLRFSELVHLRRCDLQIEESFMPVFIEQSKTDIYRDGAWVVIARSLKPTCPVNLTLRYFQSGQFAFDSEEFLFRPLTFLSKTGGYKFRDNCLLSYSKAREIVLSALEGLGLPKQDYGLHSFREGGLLQLLTPLLLIGSLTEARAMEIG